jgi:hypothetical protein
MMFGCLPRQEANDFSIGICMTACIGVAASCVFIRHGGFVCEYYWIIQLVQYNPTPKDIKVL